MVVSEKGLQWSPKTAPPKTAPIVMESSVISSASDKSTPRRNANGSTSGIRSPNVPQEVPVKKEITAPEAKITRGMIIGSRFSPSI